MFNFNLPLRIAQIVFALASVVLNGYVTHWYALHSVVGRSPHETTFLLIVSALTLLTLPYLLFNPALSHATTSRYFNKYFVLALDLILFGLWLAGFLALAIFEHSLHICAGHVCNLMIGGIAAGALLSVTFAVTTMLAILHVVRTRTGPTNNEAHEKWVGQMEMKT